MQLPIIDQQELTQTYSYIHSKEPSVCPNKTMLFILQSGRSLKINSLVFVVLLGVV